MERLLIWGTAGPSEGKEGVKINGRIAYRFILISSQIEEGWKQQMCVCVSVREGLARISLRGQGKLFTLLQHVTNICVRALKIFQETLRFEKSTLLLCQWMIKPSAFSSFFTVGIFKS